MPLTNSLYACELVMHYGATLGYAYTGTYLFHPLVLSIGDSLFPYLVLIVEMPVRSQTLAIKSVF